MKIPEKRISLRNYYRVEQGKIILGKSRYSCDMLMGISIILRFLSLFAIIYGLMSGFQIGNYKGIILSILGVLTLAWGYLYKKIVLEAAEDQKKNITGLRKIIYRL